MDADVFCLTGTRRTRKDCVSIQCMVRRETSGADQMHGCAKLCYQVLYFSFFSLLFLFSIEIAHFFRKNSDEDLCWAPRCSRVWHLCFSLFDLFFSSISLHLVSYLFILWLSSLLFASIFLTFSFLLSLFFIAFLFLFPVFYSLTVSSFVTLACPLLSPSVLSISSFPFHCPSFSPFILCRSLALFVHL